jgi:hypothetical protein
VEGKIYTLEDIQVVARRDRDPNDRIVNCRVVHLWRYFDLALQVHNIDKEPLSVEMELFFIGLPRALAFHIIREYCHMSLAKILLIILLLLTM